MRIAQVAPVTESVPPRLYGGTERVVAWLTDELVEKGHDVTLFASGDSRTAARLVPSAPLGLRLAGIRDETATILVMLNRVLRMEAEFDDIHLHTDLLQFPVFRNLAHKSLTTLHGRLDMPDRVALHQAFPDMPLVSISDSQRAPMPPHVDWLATVYHGMRNGIVNYGQGGPGLVFLGRISPEKRPDRAIEIAIRAGVGITIAAKVDDADRAYFRKEIEPLLAHPLVDFIGEVDEARKNVLLGEALALVFPIDWPEPFGLVMIEAMAAGTPVIAWRNGSVPEVIRDGLSGVIVGSIEEAVSAVEKVRHLDRRAVRRDFAARFSASRMADGYISAYHRLLERGLRPDIRYGAGVAYGGVASTLAGPHGGFLTRGEENRP